MEVRPASSRIARNDLSFCDTQTDQNREPSQLRYTLASFCGDYGIVGSYSGAIARALGTQTVDGRGNLTGSAIINQPGLNNTRSITSIVFFGTHTVNPDGTGKMALTITVQGGATVNVIEDFAITKTKTVNGSARQRDSGRTRSSECHPLNANPRVPHVHFAFGSEVLYAVIRSQPTGGEPAAGRSTSHRRAG